MLKILKSYVIMTSSIWIINNLTGSGRIENETGSQSLDVCTSVSQSVSSTAYCSPQLDVGLPNHRQLNS